ncbi:MAG: hypothetical protein AB7O97_11510 [Planctomycetota bacterium]
MNTTRLTPPLAAALLLAPASLAQMEKRAAGLYEPARFAAAAPAIGSMAPDLVLSDLDGRPQALSSWRGRVVVLIKGGFT